MVSACCDFYHVFIASPHGSPLHTQQPTPRMISDLLKRIRLTSTKTYRYILQNFLSSRRADLLPTILSLCMLGVSVCLFMDGAFAIPEPARSLIYQPSNILETCKFVRDGLYAVMLELLHFRSADTRLPWDMQCWTMIETSQSPNTSPSSSSTSGTDPIRNPIGMQMVNQDAASFDGLHRLQIWLQKYSDFLRPGKRMFKYDPYALTDLQPITALSKLFHL